MRWTRAPTPTSTTTQFEPIPPGVLEKALPHGGRSRIRSWMVVAVAAMRSMLTSMLTKRAGAILAARRCAA